MEEGQETKKCVTCKGTVKGSFLGISLSICCAECCEKAKNEEDEYCVSKRAALQDYRCKPKDLSRLLCKYQKNPIDRRFRPMHLYLIAEVEHLSSFRAATEKRQRAERAEKRRLMIMKRKESVFKTLKISAADFATEDRTLMIFLIGGYVMQNRHPKLVLKDIKARWSALPRIHGILRECPGAHPGAVIDFCAAYPHAGPTEFQELKSKVRKVFCIEGRRILHHLSSLERAYLQKTPLKEEYLEFEAKDARTMIHGHLLQRVDRSVAAEIMNHPLCQDRICRGGEECQIATKLLEFWNERHDQQKRTARLERAFFAKGLFVPDDICQCQNYMSGDADHDVEELVALGRLHHILKDEHGIFWTTPPARAGEEHLDYCLHVAKLSVDESMDAAVKHALKYKPPLVFVYDTTGSDWSDVDSR